ncbi:MAG: GDSL-type esterase/lipase family protein [Suilimivivens sp.]
MKFIRQGPLFLILLSTGVLFTLIAAGGKNTIYEAQEYEPVKAPLLSIVFTGINDDIYPWQIFMEANEEEETMEAMAETDIGTESSMPENNGNGYGVETAVESTPESTAVSAATGTPLPVSTPAAAAIPTPASTPIPTKAPYGEGRPEPLRESTREEYLNHISADIYGDVGIAKAASYEFTQVDESYFDDALFIGDSRTVGLRDYTDLSEHAQFYCETSLTIYKVLEEDFKGLGTIVEALEANDYGKIYIMVGINELGQGTTEDFMGKYTEVVDAIHELEPEAKIIIQGIMRVSGEKNAGDAIFNNSNINARNNAIATLADNETVFYIDVNEVVCDEEGNLKSDYTFDQIHLLGVYNDLWKQFLLSHGVNGKIINEKNE